MQGGDRERRGVQAVIGTATTNIDITSADGVASALKSTIATTAYRQLRARARAETMPARFSTTSTTGRTKARPVAMTIFRAKSM